MAYDKNKYTKCAFRELTAKSLRNKELKIEWRDQLIGNPATDLKSTQDNLEVLMRDYLPHSLNFISKQRRRHQKSAQYLLGFLNHQRDLKLDKSDHILQRNQLLQTVKDVRDDLLADPTTNPNSKFMNAIDTFLMRELFIDPMQKKDIALVIDKKNPEPNDSRYFSVDRQIDAEVTFALTQLKSPSDEALRKNIEQRKKYAAENASTIKPSPPTTTPKQAFLAGVETLNQNKEVEQASPVNKEVKKVPSVNENKEEKHSESIDDDFVSITQEETTLQEQLLAILKFEKNREHKENTYINKNIHDKLINLENLCKPSSTATTKTLLKETKALLDLAIIEVTRYKPPTIEINPVESFKLAKSIEAQKKNTLLLASELSSFFRETSIGHKQFKSSRQFDAYISRFIQALPEPKEALTKRLGQ